MWQFNCKFVDYKFLIEIFNQAIAIAVFYFNIRYPDISAKYAETISRKIVCFPFFFWLIGSSLLQIRWQIVEHEIEFCRKKMCAFLYGMQFRNFK